VARLLVGARKRLPGVDRAAQPGRVGERAGERGEYAEEREGGVHAASDDRVRAGPRSAGA
jgi:hypothetical protein